MMMMNIDGWLIVYQHGWLEIDAYLEWLIELELWKLKSESKDRLLVAFRQNKPLHPKSLACLVKWTKLYPLTGKPCRVLVYSALLVAFFSGENFEDMIAGLNYPCTLPPCWSMVWEGSSASTDASPSEWCLVWALSRCHVIVSIVLFTFRWINEL